MPPADPADSWAFRSGTDLGAGRTAVRLLGGGDRYEAWLGWDDHLVAPVVLKLLRPSRADRAGARAAISREAETLRSVAHPGIVRCFGADLEGERPYLVLEFLDGPRLSTLVRRFGALTHEQLVPLALEIASALGYLHNAGWLHLDVKPQNLIMGAPPRLIDLSIATRSTEVGALRAVLGTEAYMAPEQCLPERLATIGPAADVWGLGATLYEAANGWRPFPKRAPDAPYPQLTARPLPFHGRVPPALEALIRACLDPEPGGRPGILDVIDAAEDLLPAARDVALRRLNRRIR